MSDNYDSPGRIVHGNYHNVGELRTSGVTSSDNDTTAAIKLDQAKKRQQEHDDFFKTYVPVGHVEDMRSEYDKALAKAKTENAVRFALILMAAAVLFFALNTTIGGKIRDNSLYGSRTNTASHPWR